MIEGNDRSISPVMTTKVKRQRDDAELRRRLREGEIDVDVGEDARRRDHEGEPHRQPDADDAELAAVALQQPTAA